MSELTRASMHDARDAEDTRLLDAGEYGALVESYYGVILDRSRGFEGLIDGLTELEQEALRR